MISKATKVRSRAIRASAKGESCLLNLPGVCCGDSETVVFAHVNFGGHGMGTKESDLSGCYACSSCHDALDGRINYTVEPLHVFSAVMNTLHKLVEKKIILVSGFEYDRR